MRLWALPQPGSVDVKAWKAWGALAAEVGLARVYGPSDAEILEQARQRDGLLAKLSTPIPRTVHHYRGEAYSIDYPPASMVLLWAAGRAYRALDPNAAAGRLYTVLLNLLPFAASIALAFALHRSAAGPLGTERALALWCNPAVLLAAVLGYQDPVFALPALGAVAALARGRLAAAAALAALACLLKPQGSLLLPAALGILAVEGARRDWIRAALAAAAVTALALAPWWLQGHLLSALAGSLRPLGEDTLSAQGLNLWWAAGWLAQWARDGPWPQARILTLDEFRGLAGWDPRLAARLLLAAGTAANLVLLLRRPRPDPVRVPLAVVLQVHLYALLATSVHENHALLAVLLAPLLLGAWERGRTVLAATSGLLLANLFLLEGLGRGLLRDRQLWRLRMALGLDLTVVAALLHAAFVVALFAWAARRAGLFHNPPARAYTPPPGGR